MENRGTGIKKENSGYFLEVFDHLKSAIRAELKGVKYKDLEDMVYRLELPYDESVDILDVKYINGTFIGYAIPPGIYEITAFFSMINACLPDEVKVNTTIHCITLRTN